MALCLGLSRELITLPPQAGLDMRLRLEHQLCRRYGPRIAAFLARRPAADSRRRSRSRDGAGARGLSRPCAAAGARKPALAGTDPANAHPISPTRCSVCPRSHNRRETTQLAGAEASDLDLESSCPPQRLPTRTGRSSGRSGPSLDPRRTIQQLHQYLI